MKKLILLFALISVGFALGQTSTQINRIGGLRFNAPAIRDVLNQIDQHATPDSLTTTQLVVSDSANIDTLTTAKLTATGLTTFDSLSVDSINVAGNAVLDSVIIGTGASLIHSPHADTLVLAETAVNLTGVLTLGSDPSSYLDESTWQLDNGATFTNPHADTLKFSETVINLSGTLTVGSDPTEGVTAIDTTHAGRWVKITVAGVAFYAVADTSLIVN